MIKKFLLLFSFINVYCFSQNIVNFRDIVNKENIFNSICVLANDSLEGRNTGDLGQKKAANFIKEKLVSYNCQPYKDSFFQTVILTNKKKEGILTINGLKLNFPNDFGFNSLYHPLIKEINSIKLISLKQLYDNEIEKNQSYFVKINNYKDVELYKISKEFKGNIFFICKQFNKNYFLREDEKNLTNFNTKNNSFFCFIDLSKLSTLIKKQINENKCILNLNLNSDKLNVISENINCFIEGNDSLLKKEVVIISAHYDHIGKKDNVVFNGADDNASGSAALLELARIFQDKKSKGTKFKRSLLFLWFTGEEHGLLGSEYYSDKPLIPLTKTICNLNIDMIGRADSIVEKDTYKVYIIGSDFISPDLHYINEVANFNNGKLKLDYKYNDKKESLKLYYRSDQYNFAKKDIPCIFYFGGFHEDYHKSTDDIEKIDVNKIKEISVLVANTTTLLLNNEKSLEIILK